METIVIDSMGMSDAALTVRLKSDEQWVEEHGSGTLRKAKRLGFVWRNLYIQERTCHEWGWGFECLPRSRVSFGDALIEGDCNSLTEAAWHIERLIARNIFKSDIFQTKYLFVSSENINREGVGIVIRKTDAQWIPSGHIIFSIISEYNDNVWLKANNPC